MGNIPVRPLHSKDIFEHVESVEFVQLLAKDETEDETGVLDVAEVDVELLCDAKWGVEQLLGWCLLLLLLLLIVNCVVQEEVSEGAAAALAAVTFRQEVCAVNEAVEQVVKELL